MDLARLHGLYSVTQLHRGLCIGFRATLRAHKQSTLSSSIASRVGCRRLHIFSPNTRSFLPASGNENQLTTSEDTGLLDSPSVPKFLGKSAVLTADYVPPQDTPGHDVHFHEAEFPALQVLSPKQQEILSATPAHPEALYALYGTYAAACFTERVWRFIAPMVLTTLSNNLLPVAVVAFVDQFIIFVAGPWVGAVMDSVPRVQSFITLSVLQTIAMLVSVAATLCALRIGVASTSSLLRQPWFLVLVIAGAIERLTGLAIGVAAERDWVVLLAGTTRQLALAEANAFLRRIDLICEVVGPALFGLLLSKRGAPLCIGVAAVVMVASLPALIFLVHATDKLSKGVLHRSKFLMLPKATQVQGGEMSKNSLYGFEAVMQGWRNYFAQPVLPASLAYVLLHFNAVLSPGGLLTSYLTQSNINPAMIGIFRSLCGAMGLLSTFVTASAIRTFGILKVSGWCCGAFFQATLLALAVGVYLFKPSISQTFLLVMFLLLIVVSRLGHWGYDLIDAQISQTAIPEFQANQVGTAEMSLASFAELVMLGVAIIASDISCFGGLASLSMLAVASAAALYWHWLSNPTPEQLKLFPQESTFRIPVLISSSN